MNTYNIPRNVKGEGRILFVFSTKALIYTAIGAGAGFFISLILNLLNLNFVGYIIIVLLGFLGFVIGTFKMPNTNAFAITRDTGGENIDDVIKRYFQFKMAKKRIYVCTKPETTKEDKEGGEKDE